jgi:hypothetical protein
MARRRSLDSIRQRSRGGMDIRRGTCTRGKWVELVVWIFAGDMRHESVCGHHDDV